MMSKPPK